MRLHYQFSLWLSFLLIVIVPILASFLLFKAFLKATAESEFFAQADQVARGITAEIGRRSGSLLKLAQAYASNPGVGRFMETRDRAGLENNLTALFPYSDLDLLEAGDAGGIVLARAHRPGDWGEDKNDQAIIQAALKGLPGADIERGVSGIALRAVSPIVAPEGRIIGTLMTGVLLDRDFFKAFKIITGFELALFGGDSLIAATTPESPGWNPAFLQQRPAESGKVTRVKFLGKNEESWGVHIPVYHATGETFGGLLLWQEIGSILHPIRVTRLTLVFTFVIALLLAVALTVFLSRNFSSPLKQMLPIMDRVSRGETSIRIPDFSWVEFQNLAGHFRNMLLELRKSHEKIVKTQRQLLVAGKLAVLGRVTAELAHEIRNPLNSIEINLRLLIDDLQAEGRPVGDKITRLCAEVGRLKQTVTDFVQAGGKITLRREPLDLGGELQSVLELVKPQIALLGIQIKTELRHFSPIPVDRNRVHQIFLNILLNACQSMSPGGTLWVRNIETEGKQTVIIRDSGTGISQEEKERIFDFPFTTKPDGTGCGLAYVLRVVQAHQGEFDIDSEPGVGTEVKISFPGGAGSNNYG